MRGAELRVEGGRELRERLAEQTLQVVPAVVELRTHLRRRARRLALMPAAAVAAVAGESVRVAVLEARSQSAAGARALCGGRLEQRHVLVQGHQPLSERADRHRVKLYLLCLFLITLRPFH